MGELGKSYLPVDRCGELSELVADKLPAFYNRLLAECRTANSDGAEQPVVHSSDLMVPVASPPVMCWLCGDGFTHTDALVKHCKANHGDYAEYRKRLLWQAQQEGLKKLLPYVKRHLVQAASFFQAYSVPGTMCLGWRHPDSLRCALPRCEVACVVCARKDWMENRFRVHLWKEATHSKSVGEIIHGPGSTQLLVHAEDLCFGNRGVINHYLATGLYAHLMPRIPQEELYASSVVHPADPSMQWLLHTRRVPLRRDDSVAQPALQREASAAQPDSPHPCAGVGNPDEKAWICYECACCLCVDDKLVKVPQFALANLMWLGQERRLMQQPRARHFEHPFMNE